MQRRLVWIVAVLAAAWCLWWVVATMAMQRGVEGWLDARRAEGWQAEVTDISAGGFPFRLHARIKGAALADPATGVALELPHLDLMAPAYWPGYASVVFPAEPILLASPQGRVSLSALSAVVDLRLHPGTSLQVQEMTLRSGPWTLDAPGDSLLAADDLTVSMQQDAGDARRYYLEVGAAQLTPGTGPRSALRLPADWPPAFDTFTADMAVTFDAPWDRNALETRRPQPRRIDLRRAEAGWGAVRILATGELEIDAAGMPEGAVTLKAENWPQLLDIAVAAGLLPAAMRPQAETVLNALARSTGQTDDLDIELRFSGGRMALGIIPLGAAPTIRLR